MFARFAGRTAAASAAVAASIMLCGCIGDTVGERLATDIPPETVTPAYWLAEPGPSINGRDYDKLFQACQDALRRDLFVVDRVDYRDGIITSQPMVSAQFFEFWRTDTPGLRDKVDSSIATYRRTVRFDITANPDGTWKCSPKVLVERESLVGSRVTNVVQAQASFNFPVTDGLSFDAPDPPAPINWLATARDPRLERQLLENVADYSH